MYDVQALSEFLKESVSPYHCVDVTRRRLEEEGFVRLDFAEAWKLTAGAYYVTPSETMLFAFVIGGDYTPGAAMRLAIAHTDWPCLHLKPRAEFAGHYNRLDAEVYGGPILNTWLDRPLGLAGRVCIEKNGSVETQLFDSETPVITIPNLPVHFNSDVNRGVELKKQVDMCPIGGVGREEGWLARYVAEGCYCAPEHLLDLDLYVYNADAPTAVGIDGELLLSPRLDNLTSCYALLQGILARNASETSGGLSIIGLYDNEEIGSQTKQGADSVLFSMLLEKIYEGRFGSATLYKEAIAKSRLLSLDVAHALHPNHPERYDVVNTGSLGDGMIMKLSSNQRYAYDGEIVAEAVLLCREHGISFAKHMNHSDQGGGSTMGPAASAWLPMPTLDAGVPILAMHSACELMYAEDQAALERFAEVFLGK